MKPHGLDASYLSQILTGHRNLGEKAAATLEQKIGLPAGTLVSPAPASDVAPGDASPGNASPGVSAADKLMQALSRVKGFSLAARHRIAAAARERAEDEAAALVPANLSNLRPRNEEILIPQYDIRGAMGHGQVPADYNEAVRNIVVREQTLREKGVSYTAATALAMITGWGQSMESTINDQDLVVVDRGVTDFIGEGIYVVTWHQELYIKRIMRLDEDHYRLISDNPHYENQTARIDDVAFHAKVLLVWNARKV
ncbi:S24 family peptidase [Pseudomonas sp. KNUC1026]|uniref:S24 family peptidase n=1 Tax=Pseudomonas sp. KNUC1026 TaxID=2893890 RepID=UPI001F178FD8|nr:S24 family peptidase [Pseudomonas sp. KNUC1026]UFH51350.1 S24 family peptidase [Pseudomonas sp. KNUC1026]